MPHLSLNIEDHYHCNADDHDFDNSWVISTSAISCCGSSCRTRDSRACKDYCHCHHSCCHHHHCHHHHVHQNPCCMLSMPPSPPSRVLYLSSTMSIDNKCFNQVSNQPLRGEKIIPIDSQPL